MVFIELLRGYKNKCDAIYKLPKVINVIDKINSRQFESDKNDILCCIIEFKNAWVGTSLHARVGTSLHAHI